MGGEITVLVTVIGELQAKIGNTFIYLGPMLNCKNCNLKKICSNMKKGGKYKVTKKGMYITIVKSMKMVLG